MRAFFAHLWKEWRQHRAVLIGIAIALPLLTAATFVGFASFGSDLARCAAVFTGGAAVMTSLGLAVELVAGETSRRTIDFWRRQPRGLAIGWAAKLSMLVVAVALASAWAGASFWAGCRVFAGSKAAATAWESLGSRATIVVPVVALSLSMWVLLATTWVPRGAAAVGIALLLLGAIGYPGWVLWSDRTVFLATLVPTLPVAILLAIALPVGIATLSLFVGRRFGDRPWRAAAVSFAVLALATGTAYAHASARLDRWDDVRPSDPDVRITTIFVGAGGQKAYAHASRIGDDVAVRSFAIDLGTGISSPIGPKGTHVYPRSESRPLRWPRTGLTVLQTSDGCFDSTKATQEYFDGKTGASLGTYRMRPYEGRALEIALQYARDVSPVRTLDGRRAWFLLQLTPARGTATDGSPIWGVETWIERERSDGGVERTVFAPEDGITLSFALPSGWWGHRSGRGPDEDVFVPADARTAADCLPMKIGDKGNGQDRIDARHYLWLRFQPARVNRQWRIVDVMTGGDVEAPGMTSDDQLLSLDGASALVWRQRPSQPSETPQRGAIVRVNVTSGASSAASAFDDGVPTDLRWVAFVGTTPEGRAVLAGSSGQRMGYLLFDPAANRLLKWTPQEFAGTSVVALILDEETLYVTGYDPACPTWGIRLDRLRLGTGERTRLFPR